MSDFLQSSPWEAVIGLEVHAQLKTNTKIFSDAPVTFGDAPNSRTTPVCMGLPGALPVLNRQAVEFALRLALATDSDVAPVSIFARKNYFYPDLPKGYQISQFEEPFCQHGVVEFQDEQEWKKVGLTRIHLEEDAGKLLHSANGGNSRVDLNRCGTPLVEIVSEPDIRTPREAALFLSQVRRILRYLDICDGNMEEGSLRCDANVSVRKKGAGTLGTKTEVKNMNSFRNVEKAINFEIHRQIDALEHGETITQQTLSWDAGKNVATPMRDKEDSHDYRYFPDPDLVPLHIDDNWIADVRKALPELPGAKKRRFMKQYDLSEYAAAILTETIPLADYFETVVRAGAGPKQAGNWIMTDVLRVLNDRKIDITAFSITAENLAALICRIQDGAISGKIAKDLFENMLASGQSVDALIEEKGLRQITDDQVIQDAVRSVLQEYPAEADAYRQGKQKVLGFLVGQVMKATGGKANPHMVNDLLKQALETSAT